jgi:tight adherence protein B
MSTAGQPLAHVATVTERLSVLLSAGIPPTEAWRYLAESMGAGIPADVVAARPEPQNLASTLAIAVDSLPPMERSAWRGLAAAWSIAIDVGAPMAPVLTAFADSLRELAAVQRDIEVSLAAPVATAKLVLTLPAIGIGLGFALGFNTVAVLFGSAVGVVCAIAGGALMVAAARWNRRLVARAQPNSATPGIECELLAIAVSGGGSLDRARELLDETLHRFALDDRSLEATSAGDDHGATRTVIDSVIELSERAGVPARQLLRSEAAAARRAASALAQERAAKLTVRLMLPLGMCVLPAFVLLGVVPMLMAVVSSTVGEF